MKRLNTVAVLISGLSMLIGCAATGPTAVQPTGASTLSRLVKTVQQAVVTVQTFDENMKPTGIGTGFFVDADGHLVTNYHVLDGAFAAAVKTAKGDKFPIDLVLAENKAVDLVKVSVDMPAEKVDWIKVTGDVPNIAEQIIVVGNPLGLEQTVSEGIVSAIRDVPGSGKIFQMSAPIAKGSSGSPVINRSGQVIGVVSFQSLVGQNINFAVAGQGVVDLINARNPVTLGEWTYQKSKERPELAKSLCRSGFQFSIRGQYKEALAYYREATEQEPDDSESWYGLGHCYVGLERTEEAIEAYKEVIRTDPDNPFAHYNLGRYYVELGELGEAVGVFQAAESVDPKYIPAIFDMAVALGKLGRTAEELDAYEKVIRINPKFFPAHHQMGLAYLRMGRHEEALRSQKSAIELNPDYAPAHLALGLTWHDLEEEEKARSAYHDALRIDPDFSAAHYQIGILYLEAGQHGAALQQYKILKKLDEDLAERLFERIYP